MAYLSEEGRKNLPSYEYRGADKSKIYKYFFKPLITKLVTYVPSWVAPNVITLTGFMLICVSHYCAFMYAPKLVGDSPWWVYVVCSVSLFLYQILDNLDGTQARATGSGSPLGLMFDHGCDAVNVTVTSLTFASVLQTGATWKTLLLWGTAACVFYFNTWEEYHTGELVLPVINGPNEGLILTEIMMLLPAFLGSGIWLQESLITGVQNNTIVVVLEAITGFSEVIQHVLWVVKSILSKRGSLIDSFVRILPFVILMSGAGLWILLSPQNVMAAHPRLVTWTFGLLFSKLVMHLMLSHLCDERYNAFRKTLVPMAIVLLHCGFTYLHGEFASFDEAILIEEFFLVAAVSFAHMVHGVVVEMKEALDVNCFTIKKKGE